MRHKILSLIISTMLVAPAGVVSYAQQVYQFGKCEVAPANKEAALRAVYITMPDGAKIAADVILPRDLPAETKLPAVLTQTRYWRATEGRQPTGADRYWINHGFAVVNTDVRGTGASFGDYRVAQLVAACREWAKGDVPSDYAMPVRSDVPALLVSGALDPNTNERWSEEAARYLSPATHVAPPNMSHGFSSVSECGANFIAAFIDAASAQNVGFSCKDRVQLPPFALSAH